MANLSESDILKFAKLSNLELSTQELIGLKKDLSEILEYIDTLKSIDTSDLKPTIQVNGLTNVYRPDDLIDYGIAPSDLLKNAPKLKDNQIEVKRVLG